LRRTVRRAISADRDQPTWQMRTLETERLVLREFHSKDLRDVAGWGEVSGTSSAELAAQEFLDFCFREYRERGLGPWGMILKKTGRIIGNCGFPHLDRKRNSAEVNYYVAPQHRGAGLASEALKALMQFGFADMGWTQIQARCTADNVASERVMQKAGMKLRGTVPSGPSTQEEGREERLYVALPADFKLPQG
jgi:ribosomal-protein-alanine N-acetyltransferase